MVQGVILRKFEWLRSRVFPRWNLQGRRGHALQTSRAWIHAGGVGNFGVRPVQRAGHQHGGFLQLTSYVLRYGHLGDSHDVVAG